MTRYALFVLAGILHPLVPAPSQTRPPGAVVSHDAGTTETTPDNERATPKACLNGLAIDRSIYRDVPHFCESLQPFLRPRQFSLDVERMANDTCKARMKWMGIALEAPALLKCLKIDPRKDPGEGIDFVEKDHSFVASPNTYAKISFDFTDSEGTAHGMGSLDCKKKLRMEDLEIVLSETDSGPLEEDDEEEGGNQIDEQSIPKFAYCEWSIVDQDGSEISIEKLESDGFTVGIKENKDDIDCNQNGNSRYDCTHEIDDSSHTVILSLSNETTEKTSTCNIPSQKELSQEQRQFYAPLPVNPALPPKPIRFNFGGPILSPGVL